MGFDYLRASNFSYKVTIKCLAKAKNNMKILGFTDRIRFQKGDIFRSDYSKRKFDLFVSNLVFHNFGRKRFSAYERLA